MPDHFVAGVIRVVAGGALAVAAAAAAHRAGSLSRSGMIAAGASGILCAVGGWRWLAILAVYFAAATIVGRFAGADRDPAVGRIVSKGGARDWLQVIANGGVYALCAAVSAGLHAPWLSAGALGALAASSADTWATEIGIRYGGIPRLITSGSYVRSGESGGFTTAGVAGSVAGALVVAASAVGFGFGRGPGIACLAGGICGSIADSVMGATVQERRWCDQCGEATERNIHVCGRPSRHVGGIQTLDNDVINILSTAAGFLAGIMVYWAIGQMPNGSTFV
ncbi:MAG: DUF92 domain-containing protein [Gemmatimonadota bacterium]|nr:DUF92 domain-containing protein [Gemmatimonadota bacterium]